MMMLRSAWVEEADGIFIGSGHNALIAANYLARAGARVIVLEAQGRIGGGLCTEEITLPLFRHNLHVFFVRWSPNYRIWRDLALDRYGMEILTPEVQNAIPFQEGGGLATFHSLERSLEAIRRISPKDAETYARVHQEFSELAARILDPLRFAPPLPEEELIERLSRSLLGRRLLRWWRPSALDLVRELFDHEAVRALILCNAAVRGYLPILDVPWTGYIVVQALPVSHTGSLVRGGSAMAARALAAALYASGGRIFTRAPVERVLVENGRAIGVMLQDGRRIRARRFVCSSLPAPLTLGRLVEPSYLDPSLREALARYRWNEEALLGVHLALSSPPCYRGVEPEDPLNRALNQYVGYESSQALERSMRQIREGRLPEPPGLHVGIPTHFDPSQAPPGYATAFAWVFVPTGPAAMARWEGSECESYVQQILERWAEYAPDLTDRILAIAVHTPADTERWIPSMQWGDRHHGSYHPENFWARRPHPALSHYRTPIEGLYLCGSGTFPGGSFTGQPGYNAATVIAEDLGYPRWWGPRRAEEVLAELENPGGTSR
ncbi:Phytoene desaturase (neurosporene-forming) [Candidatus Thermoflexus japonica]|uniref:Pyridine nucleotide-disulfide oxidoreductase domain-containing protein 2 n=1 Tax=Candidatus Thermoflexus japonica TaxID=2035417 RepID=A0A2H5Y4V6_9CHLR|nr:Phytoene desaturase (neurosporene-forming) [Candidatus Thermoflexus japonica]